MIQWLIFKMPWWIQFGVIGVVVASVIVIASVFFGFERVRRFILPIGLIVAAGALLSRAQQKGYEARGETEKKAADKAIDAAVEARGKAAIENADPVTLRKDDGHKRKPKPKP